MTNVTGKTKKFDVLTVFDSCVDLIVDLGDTVPEFDQKEKLVRDFGLYMGGSACIFAAQCAKLGLSTAGVGVVGKDTFGQLVSGTLRDCGVDTSYLREDGTVKTGLGIALVRGKDRSILTYDQSIQEVESSWVTQEMLEHTRHLHIASYYLLKNLRPGLEEILRQAKELGVTVSLDTNWDPEERWELPEELLKQVDVFLPNEAEIQLLSGKKTLAEAIDYYLQAIPMVVVKRGEQGAVAATRERREEVPAKKVSVADTVGAGDSFDGGFLFGYLQGYSLEKSLEIGVACGSGNVSCFGGYNGQPTLEQVKHLTESGKACETPADR